jgi:hypothetical protein
VDQASAYMQTKTQKPQNQKDNENGPKHVNLLRYLRDLPRHHAHVLTLPESAGRLAVLNRFAAS